MKKNKLFILFMLFMVIAIVVAVSTIEIQDEASIEEVGYIVASEDFLNGDLVAEIDTSALSPEEIDGLLLMREEEKLARDVYNALYDAWGLKIFMNIARSEQTHTDSVKVLLDRYDIEDPAGKDIVGYFENEDIQSLYDTLVEQGSESLESAVFVGATIEDLDIRDISVLLEDVDNDDIRTVYENLIRGSENHMKAFIRQLTSMGATYEPQYITQDELDRILSQ